MLEKSKRIDKIEVLDTGEVQFRERISILENGETISTTYHRWLIAPGQDIPECANSLVREICSVVHTDELIKKYCQVQQPNVSEGD